MDAASLNAIFDALPDPALVVRTDAYAPGRRVVMANTAARRMFHISEAQPMIASVIRRPDLLDRVEAALFQGAASEVEWEAAGTAQDLRYRAIIRPLPQGGDGARLALVVVRDETDARRNERMRADFLANASHELKTPLASLRGFIETLRGHAKDDPEAREHFLEIMHNQTERMIRLVGDLLSLSRVELNEHIRPAGEVDLNGCVQDVVDGLEPIAAARRVKIEVKADTPVIFTGDRHQILQVVQNLVENAVKHSPDNGRVQIEVLDKARPADLTRPKTGNADSRSLLTPDSTRAPVFAAVRIQDSGKGVAREHLPRLTERFYRAPGQKSGDTSGTGLGLAIAKHIVNRHRGGLFVESVEGEGATFTAYFPQENG